MMQKKTKPSITGSNNGKKENPFIRGLKSAWIGLFHGLRAGDEVVSTTPASAVSDGTNIQMSMGSLASDLLKGEVTQQVKETRHQLYAVGREADNYEYIGNGKVIKKDPLSFKFPSYENSDGYPIQLIQDNQMVVKSVLEALNELGKYESENDMIIRCTRTFVPKFKIEKYADRLVVKRVDDKTAYLQFYVPKFFDKADPLMSKMVQSEMENILKGNTSDVTDIATVHFLTQKAYGYSDLFYFEYDELKYDKCVFFNGEYVICYYANIKTDGLDETDKYMVPEMQEKYANKERKNYTVSFEDVELVNGQLVTCEECGKKFEKFIGDLSKETTGKVLCYDCLIKRQAAQDQEFLDSLEKSQFKNIIK